MHTQAERDAALQLTFVRVRIASEVLDREESRGCDDWEWPAWVGAADRHSLIADYYTWNGWSEDARGCTTLGLGQVKAYLLAALLKHARETVKP